MSFVVCSSGGISIEDIQPSFLFARFENIPAEAEVEIAQQQSFQNPMFNLAGVKVVSIIYILCCRLTIFVLGL